LFSFWSGFINSRSLFCVAVIGAAFIILAAAAAATSSYDKENAKENETIGNVKEIEEIFDAEEFTPGKKANDTAQNKQAT
jgi:hypothetical protein